MKKGFKKPVFDDGESESKPTKQVCSDLSKTEKDQMKPASQNDQIIDNGMIPVDLMRPNTTMVQSQHPQIPQFAES